MWFICWLVLTSANYIVNSDGSDINNLVCDENNPCASLNNVLYAIYSNDSITQTSTITITISGISQNESNINCSFNSFNYDLTITITNNSLPIINTFCINQLLAENMTNILESDSNNLIIDNLYYEANNDIGLFYGNSFVCNNCSFSQSNNITIIENTIIKSNSVIIKNSVFNNIMTNETFIQCNQSLSYLTIINSKFSNLNINDYSFIDFTDSTEIIFDNNIVNYINLTGQYPAVILGDSFNISNSMFTNINLQSYHGSLFNFHDGISHLTNNYFSEFTFYPTGKLAFSLNYDLLCMHHIFVAMCTASICRI